MRIRALLIRPKDYQTRPIWEHAQPCEENEFDILSVTNDYQITSILNRFDPDVIVSFGEWKIRTNLIQLSYHVRRRWISLDENANPQEIGQAILFCYMGWVGPPSQPLVSVFSPAFENPLGISRAYTSLLNQTWLNWEWVIVDDSEDSGMFQRFKDIIGQDHRITLWRPHRRSGRIGQVKKMACGLCVGEYLAELDHDDELTVGGLEEVVRQFQSHPNAGMVWTDCTEVDDVTKTCHQYPEGWGFGFGSYREEVYQGRTYQVAQGPELNPTTIRHIVGCPNHIRVWRREAYHSLGGHNPRLPVCDDYDLIVRTWLKYEVVHSSLFGYIQWRTEGSGTFSRNREIQRLTRWLSSCYSRAIDQRAKELEKDE